MNKMEEPQEMGKQLDETVTKRDIRKFITASVLGVFLFLVPIPNEGSFTIPAGVLIDWVASLLKTESIDFAEIFVLIFITMSCLLTFCGYFFKPKFIMENEKLKSIAFPSPFYMISRFIGLIFCYLTIFKIGPEFVWSADTGGSMLSVSAVLVSVVVVIAFAMPLLTDFGIMEFVGVLVQKFVRFFFTCPGRSAIDLMTSWFGASNAAVILTTRQYESGFYSAREALVISTNFSLVSIPFCFVIAKLINVESYFTIWYIIICITGMIIAMIMPRIWPLRNVPDTYDKIAGKQINEETPTGVNPLKWALNLAGKRAIQASLKDVFDIGLDVYLSLFLDLIPLVMAWGTLILIFVEYTQLFQIAAIPLGYFMQLLGIENAMHLSPSMLVGFGDMYIPPLLLANEPILKTRFILGAVSLVQIVYMTEVGAIILKSRIPTNVGQLFIIFLERTLLALPIVTLLANLLVFR